MEKETWTPETVKRDLPNVLGQRGSKVYHCSVSGRLCKFACVCIRGIDVERTSLVKPLMGPCFQVAWETVAHCLNSGRPIILD